MPLSRNTVMPAEVLPELVEAVASDNPAKALAKVLNRYRGTSFYQDLEGKAKALLFVQDSLGYAENGEDPSEIMPDEE